MFNDAITGRTADLKKQHYLFFRSESASNQDSHCESKHLGPSATIFPGSIFRDSPADKGDLISSSIAWFFKPNGIHHVIVSIRRGFAPCLDPFCSHIPEHAFSKSRTQKSVEWVPQLKIPNKGQRKRESSYLVLRSKERQKCSV